MNARLGAILLSLTPAVALAQGAAANVAEAMGGFFKPQPAGDVSLTHMGDPAAAPAPLQPQAIPPAPLQATPAPVAAVPAVNPAVSAAIAQRQEEQEADRVERENERVRMENANAPKPINGAFTGLTDPRDR